MKQGETYLMYTLGIIMLDYSFDLEMSEKLHSYGFESKEIKKMDQLSEVDGILINVNQKINNHTIKGLEWLTNLKKEKCGVPIWLYTDTPMTPIERKLCLHLGANGILVRDSEEEENDFIIMKNILGCLVQPENSSMVILNKEAHSLSFNGQEEISFTRLEFQVFSFLYDHAGEVVTYQQISDYLCNGEREVQQYRISNIIFLIRKKLGEEGKDLIRTIRTKGFQLNKMLV
ncbi:winged helix-turn-helix domain-containing protein [Enterococcus plantarum]|uniref:winged helix-turn-helix domain-containing protein n=1 Tax=Enterococcus plantarum TaxID=1077675 RepID=UPI001A8DAEB2|nr:winged helix-turn-helix domain-containing protein [Enterococcus plantarum]